ncbi:hypothetical protein BG004_006223 [Podila humilis]|nr:hypothetical protein BG004_006223 [Podila humilis]
MPSLDSLEEAPFHTPPSTLPRTALSALPSAAVLKDTEPSAIKWTAINDISSPPKTPHPHDLGSASSVTATAASSSKNGRAHCCLNLNNIYGTYSRGPLQQTRPPPRPKKNTSSTVTSSPDSASVMTRLAPSTIATSTMTVKRDIIQEQTTIRRRLKNLVTRTIANNRNTADEQGVQDDNNGGSISCPFTQQELESRYCAHLQKYLDLHYATFTLSSEEQVADAGKIQAPTATTTATTLTEVKAIIMKKSLEHYRCCCVFYDEHQQEDTHTMKDIRRLVAELRELEKKYRTTPSMSSFAADGYASRTCDKSSNTDRSTGCASGASSRLQTPALSHCSTAYSSPTLSCTDEPTNTTASVPHLSLEEVQNFTSNNNRHHENTFEKKEAEATLWPHIRQENVIKGTATKNRIEFKDNDRNKTPVKDRDKVGTLVNDTTSSGIKMPHVNDSPVENNIALCTAVIDAQEPFEVNRKNKHGDFGSYLSSPHCPGHTADSNTDHHIHVQEHIHGITTDGGRYQTCSQKQQAADKEDENKQDMQSTVVPSMTPQKRPQPNSTAVDDSRNTPTHTKPKRKNR